jgi:hypothetical protein
MSDDGPKTAGWTAPTRPDGTPLDTMFTNLLPGWQIPYNSLGAQILDARRQSRTLPGAAGGTYSNTRNDYGNFTQHWPGGGYPIHGSPTGLLNQPTGGGQPTPGGGGAPNPGGGGGGPVTQPGAGGGAPQDAPNGFGPFAPPAEGVGNWQDIVNRTLGGNDPVATLRNLGTGKGIADARRTLLGAGMNPYAAAQIENAFGNSGADAEQSAKRLGLLDQFVAGGQFGLRNHTGMESYMTPGGQLANRMLPGYKIGFDGYITAPDGTRFKQGSK